MKNYFEFEKYGTNYKTETIAGLTTFFTMAYIIFVNPSVLSSAYGSNMPATSVYIATIIAAATGTLVMALYANVPYALAPGMGINAFFSFTVCGAMGFSWQEALAMVFICGVIGMIFTATGLRKMLIQSLPPVLQSAIGGGIGLFIAYIGVKESGLIEFGGTSETLTAGAAAIPALVNFSCPAVLTAIFGMLLIITLIVLNVKGAIFIGIISTAIVSLVVIALGADASRFFHSMPVGSNISDVFAGIYLSPSQIWSDISSITDTAFKLDFTGLLAADKLFLSITALTGFVLTDIFDTIGTLIGTGKRTGIFDQEMLSSGRGARTRLEKALFADLTATTIGSLCGTSNVSTYVESTAGITAGGKTGFTSVVTAGMFIFCALFVSMVEIIPAAATAPPLIVVGIFMIGSVMDIDWADFAKAAPAFLTIVFMPFAYSITAGISIGFLVYVLIKLITGKIKEVKPIMLIFTILFVLNFVMIAIENV